MADETTLTPEQAEQLRVQLAAYDQERQAEQAAAQAAEQAAARAARDEKLAPLRAVVDNEAFDQIATDLKALVPQFVGDDPLFAMIKGLSDIMPQLKEWAAK